MPQSLVQNYLHITFSTKGREPWIDKSIQEKLHAYMAGICNEMECYAIEIGGVEDHVHILCLVNQKIPVMKLLENVKKNSSKWIKTQGEQYEYFYCQNGYGAFSVNPSQIEIVRQYIQNQEEHHKDKSYQEEVRMFLKKYNVEYDEKYVWD